MTRSLLFSLIVLGSLYALPAHATLAADEAFKCYTILDPHPDAQCIVMQYRGRKGLWLDIATADKVSRAYMLAPELKLAISQHAQAESLYEKEALLMQQALKLKDTQNETLLVALAKQERLAAETQARLDAAQNEASPVFWALVGALAGFVIVGGIALAL